MVQHYSWDGESTPYTSAQCIMLAQIIPPAETSIQTSQTKHSSLPTEGRKATETSLAAQHAWPAKLSYNYLVPGGVLSIEYTDVKKYTVVQVARPWSGHLALCAVDIETALGLIRIFFGKRQKCCKKAIKFAESLLLHVTFVEARKNQNFSRANTKKYKSFDCLFLN